MISYSCLTKQFNSYQTTLLLQMFGMQVSTLGDVVQLLQSDATLRGMLPELTKIVRLILTVPVTMCSAERGFSGLRRLKSYLRNTMTSTRLNNIAVLNCHRSYLEAVDIDQILNEFISKNTVRLNTFAMK